MSTRYQTSKNPLIASHYVSATARFSFLSSTHIIPDSICPAVWRPESLWHRPTLLGQQLKHSFSLQKKTRSLAWKTLELSCRNKSNQDRVPYAKVAKSSTFSYTWHHEEHVHCSELFFFFLLYDPKGHFIVPQLSLSSAFSCSYFTVIRSPVFTFSTHISGVHAFGRRLCNFVGNSREGCVYGFVVERCAPGL